MAIETRRPRYAPHSATGRDARPLSDKQRAWLPELQDETARLARTAYDLAVDGINLAQGEHTDATRKNAIDAVRTLQNETVVGVRGYRADTMTQGQFSLLVAVRDGLRELDRRNRANVAGMLAQRFPGVKPATAAAPAGPAPTAGLPTLPEGLYAVKYADILRFYRLVHGKGRHTGRTFLNRFRSDAEDFVGRVETAESLRKIAADPQAARMTFARESVRCYLCGRKLTDTVSRARGIGPDCANK